MDSDSSQPPLCGKDSRRRRDGLNVRFADLAAKLFIKNYRDTNSPAVRKRYGYLGSLYGLVTNLLLFTAKIICSFIFALETLRADAINNASDIGMCVLALVSVFIASRPASKQHPYGSARFEYIGSLVIALLIIVLASSQVVDTVTDMIASGGLQPASVDFASPSFYVPFVVMCCSILIKLSQYFLLTGLAKRSTSMTLEATGKDARNDSIVSMVIAASLLLSAPIGWDIDPITAIGVSLLVCLSGISIIREAASAILGTTPSNRIIKSFADYIRQYPLVLGLHDLEMHTYGSSVIHAYVHVDVDASLPLMTIRDEVDHIEKETERNLGIRTVIHIDPILIGDPETDRFREYVIEAAQEIDPDIAVNDFRLLHNPDDAHRILLIFDLILPYDLLSKEKEVIGRVKETVKSFTNLTVNFSIDVDDRTSDLLLLLEDDQRRHEEL